MTKRYLLSLALFLIFPFIILATEGVEINTASLEELDELIGVGPALGQKIINERPFSSIDELLRVSGIGEKTLQKIKDQGLACVSKDPNIQIPITNQSPIFDDPSKPLEEQIQTPIPPPTTAYPTGIILNELLPSPEGSDQDNEWIEIYNKNGFVVDLFNWRIYDTEGKITQYTIPLGTKIDSYGFLVLTRPQTKIILNNTADGLTLYNPGGVVVDKVTYREAKIGWSYSKIKSEWIWSDKPSPGKKNIAPLEEISTTEKTNKTLLASIGDIPANDKTNTILLIGGIVAITLTISSYIVRKKLINTPLGDKNNERT